jgi:Ribbon-helix-helix protein, copG family
VRRTQLYLDDDLWKTLHVKARSGHTTVSELVREAVRQRYFGQPEARIKAMEAFVGIRQAACGALDATETVRRLRRGNRIERLAAE